MNKILASALLLSVVIASPRVAAITAVARVPVVATPATAKPKSSKESSFYVGASVGNLSIGGLVGYKFKKSNTQFKGPGTLAIEGRYNYINQYANSMGVDAVGMYPTPYKKLSAFASLGLGFVSFTSVCATCQAIPSRLALGFGLGAQYNLNNKFAVRAGASNFSGLYVAGTYSF